MELPGKNAIVTGAANGIGKCLAERLADEGVNVGAFDMDMPGLERLARESKLIRHWRCNICNSWETAICVNDFYQRFGTIDILVNNAAIVRNSPLVSFWKGGIKKHDIVLWDNVISTNLSGMFYMTLAAVDKMAQKRTKGVVVNVSSVAATGNAGQGAYSAAKAGVEAATLAWARELSALRIRVAGIAPGFTNTQTTRDSLSGKHLGSWIKRTPSRRLAEPSEIVDGILFIIRNDFFNGKILRLDGGLVI